MVNLLVNVLCISLEFDQEERDRLKEAEAKSNSEVKELVKRKILKKQEAKLKAEKQAQTKIEKILTEGDLAISLADNNNLQKCNLNTKENLECAVVPAIAKKRQNRKRRISSDATTVPTEVQNSSLALELSLPVKRPPKPRKKMVIESNTEPIVDQPQPMDCIEVAEKTQPVASNQNVLPAFQYTFNNEYSTEAELAISKTQIEMVRL